MSPSHFNHTMTFSDNIDEANGAYYIVIPRSSEWAHGVWYTMAQEWVLLHIWMELKLEQTQ